MDQNLHDDVSGASKGIASSYGVSKDDIVAYFIVGISLAIIVSIIPILIISKTKQSKIAALDTQYQDTVTTQLATLKKEQISQAAVSKQIDALTTALASRMKNSALIEDLSRNTLKKAKWTAMTLNGDSVSLNLTTDNFEDMAKSVAAYRGMDAVSSVKLSSANSNEASGKVDFAVELMVDLSAYKQTVVATDGADQTVTEDVTPIL